MFSCFDEDNNTSILGIDMAALTNRWCNKAKCCTLLTIALSLLCISGCADRPKEGSFDWSLESNQTQAFRIYCFKDHVVKLEVRSDGKSDIDLFVDRHGRDILKDKSTSSDCYLAFIPDESGTYQVKVANRTLTNDPERRNGPNNGTLTFKQVEKDKGLPKEGTLRWSLGKGQSQMFPVYCFKDHEVEVTVKSSGKSDVDLVVNRQGRTIVEDESSSSDCRVSFLPQTSGFYQFIVINRVLEPLDPEGRNGPNSGTLTFKQTGK